LKIPSGALRSGGSRSGGKAAEKEKKVGEREKEDQGPGALAGGDTAIHQCSSKNPPMSSIWEGRGEGESKKRKTQIRVHGPTRDRGGGGGTKSNTHQTHRRMKQGKGWGKGSSAQDIFVKISVAHREVTHTQSSSLVEHPKRDQRREGKKNPSQTIRLRGGPGGRQKNLKG